MQEVKTPAEFCNGLIEKIRTFLSLGMNKMLHSLQRMSCLGSLREMPIGYLRNIFIKILRYERKKKRKQCLARKARLRAPEHSVAPPTLLLAGCLCHTGSFP